MSILGTGFWETRKIREFLMTDVLNHVVNKLTSSRICFSSSARERGMAAEPSIIIYMSDCILLSSGTDAAAFDFSRLALLVISIK